jgi:hypothetical protein
MSRQSPASTARPPQARLLPRSARDAPRPPPSPWESARLSGDAERSVSSSTIGVIGGQFDGPARELSRPLQAIRPPRKDAIQHLKRQILRQRMFLVLERLHLRQREQRRAQRKTRQRLARLENMRPGPSRVCICKTTASRSGSMGGLVTCAKRCRKNAYTGRGARASGAAAYRRPSTRRPPCPRPPSARDHAHLFAGVAEAVLQPVQLRRIERLGESRRPTISGVSR